MIESKSFPECSISREYLKISLSSLFLPIISFMPRMVLMGVLISWLIEERNSSFAALAFLAFSSATFSLSFESSMERTYSCSFVTSKNSIMKPLFLPAGLRKSVIFVLKE